jgi:cell division protein FtsW
VPSYKAWELEPAEAEASLFLTEAEASSYERHSPQSNWTLWMLPLLLSLFGIAIIAFLASGTPSGTASYAVSFKQFQFLGLGWLFMLIVYVTPLSLSRRLSRYLWLAALLMAWATLIPGVGVKVGGSRRWLNLGFIQFQPLEILTLAVPLYLADRLDASKKEGFQRFWSPSFLIALLSALPLYLQPNMGGLILIFAICISMHVVDSGWKYPLLGGFFLVLFFILMIHMREYRMSRVSAFLDPWEDPLKSGFQIIQGLVAFSNGGILGMGVGKGLQKMNYLPAAQTDYIFPVIGEEFGLIGTLAVIFSYIAWTWKSYQIYRRSREPYTSLLIWGMTGSVLFPMFVNLGGVMKLMPLSGIPLPFLSAGGTSLVFMWVRVGFLLRIGKEFFLRDTSGGLEASPYGRRQRQ